jgi:hypothetical protein
MVRRFAPWLIHQMNLAMSIRLGSGLTDAHKQRIHDGMQEVIEDILADCGLAPVAKSSGVPLAVVARKAAAGADPRAHADGVAQASA